MTYLAVVNGWLEYRGTGRQGRRQARRVVRKARKAARLLGLDWNVVLVERPV